jgi:hypothetical protein
MLAAVSGLSEDVRRFHHKGTVDPYRIKLLECSPSFYVVEFPRKFYFLLLGICMFRSRFSYLLLHRDCGTLTSRERDIEDSAFLLFGTTVLLFHTRASRIFFRGPRKLAGPREFALTIFAVGEIEFDSFIPVSSSTDRSISSPHKILPQES